LWLTYEGMTNAEAKAHLERLRSWAREKIQAGEEPPWAWYQYMKLVETVDAIVESQQSVVVVNPTDHSPQSEQRPDGHLRLVVDSDPQDTAQRHPTGTPTTLPVTRRVRSAYFVIRLSFL
jgi:hypothetical protein